MAEPGGGGDNLFSSDDLLAAALGESGVDLEEDYENALGGVFSQSGWTANNIFDTFDDGMDYLTDFNMFGGAGQLSFPMNSVGNGFDSTSGGEQLYKPSTPFYNVEQSQTSAGLLPQTPPQQQSLFRPFVSSTAVPTSAGAQMQQTQPLMNPSRDSLLLSLLNGNRSCLRDPPQSALPVVPSTDSATSSLKKELTKR